MGDLAGERKAARAVEQAAIVAIATPRQKERGKFHDLSALHAHRIEHLQLLEHSLPPELVWREAGEGEISDFLARPGDSKEL